MAVVPKSNGLVLSVLYVIAPLANEPRDSQVIAELIEENRTLKLARVPLYIHTLSN